MMKKLQRLRNSQLSRQERISFIQTQQKWLDDADINVEKKVLKTLKVTDNHKFSIATATPEPTEEAAATETPEVTEAAEETETPEKEVSGRETETMKTEEAAPEAETSEETDTQEVVEEAEETATESEEKTE